MLTNGTGELQSGLTAGIGPVGELVGGLGLLEAGVAKFSGKLPSPKDLEELRRSSPGLFGSGYFVLAAIEGAPADARNAAAFVLNIQHGGNAGEIAVISRYGHYLALGDSLAFGYSEKRFEENLPDENPAAFETGYVNDFADVLRFGDPRLQIVTTAVPARRRNRSSGPWPTCWRMLLTAGAAGRSPRSPAAPRLSSDRAPRPDHRSTSSRRDRGEPRSRQTVCGPQSHLHRRTRSGARL